MKKIILILSITLASIAFVTLGSKHISNNDQDTIHVQETIDSANFFNQYRGKQLSFGLTQPMKRVFSNEFIISMKENFDIEINIEHYNTNEQLNAALNTGKINLIADRLNPESSHGEFESQVRIPSTTLGINNVNNLVHNVGNLKNKRIGSVKNSELLTGPMLLHGEDNLTLLEFDSLEEGLNAIERQEIDLFMSHHYMRHELIDRPQLKIELAYPEEILPVQLSTNDKTLVGFLDEFVDYIKFFNELSFEANPIEIYTQNLNEKIRQYLKTTHATAIEQHDSINVILNNTRFPYAYQNDDGEFKGTHINMLKKLTELTGIESNVINEENTNTHSNELSNNRLQFIFGTTKEYDNKNTVFVGYPDTDNIVVIVRTGEQPIVDDNLEDIHLGSMDSLQSYIPYIFDTYSYTDFENFEPAINALISGEIDALIGYRSTLEYYQNVRGYTAISASPVLERPILAGVLGNADNTELNLLMADAMRLYELVHINDSNDVWSADLINYCHSYAELASRNERRLAIFTIASVLIVVTLLTSVVVIYIKRSRKLK